MIRKERTKRNKVWRFLRTFMFLVLAMLLLASFFLRDLHDFFVIQDELDSKVAIVESWIPVQSLNQVAEQLLEKNYETIFLTGGGCGDEFCMTVNGFLIYDLTREDFPQDLNTEITLHAKGSIAMGNYPAFNLWVNNQMVGTTYTSSNPRKYKFNWNGERKIEQVKIQFLNDAFDGRFDRNLIVNYLQIGKQVFLPRKQNVSYDMYAEDGLDCIATNYQNYAEKAAYFLTLAGVDSKKLHIVNSTDYKGSNTYGSGMALAKYLDDQELSFESMNLYTIAIHSYRSQKLFQVSLGERSQLGVIPIPHPYYNPKWWWYSRKGIMAITKECVAFVWFNIIT